MPDAVQQANAAALAAERSQRTMAREMKELAVTNCNLEHHVEAATQKLAQKQLLHDRARQRHCRSKQQNKSHSAEVSASEQQASTQASMVQGLQRLLQEAEQHASCKEGVVAGLRQEVRDLSERLHAATNVQFTQAGYAGKQTKYNNNWTDLCIRLLAVGNKKAAVLPTVKAVMDFFRISADALPRTNSSVDIAEDVAGVCCMEQVHWEMMEDTGENESASIQIGTDTSPKYNDKRSIMGVNAEIVYTDTTTNKVTRKKKYCFPLGGP